MLVMIIVTIVIIMPSVSIAISIAIMGGEMGHAGVGLVAPTNSVGALYKSCRLAPAAVITPASPI